MLFVLSVGLILTLVTGIVFVVKGFKTSFLWGIALWLVPFAQIPFAIKYWERSSVTFIVFMLGNVMLLAGLFGGATALLQAQMHSQGAPTEEIATLDFYRPGSFQDDLAARQPVLPGAEDSAAPEPQPAPEPEPEPEIRPAAAAPAPMKVKYGYRELDPADLPAHLHSRVRIEVASGRVREGKLLAAGNGELTLQVRLSGGSMEFTLKSSDIRNVKLWSRVTS